MTKVICSAADICREFNCIHIKKHYKQRDCDIDCVYNPTKDKVRCIKC